MYCYCKDEFDWLMNTINEDNCFSSFKDISDFIDGSFVKLRYMRKRFGYPFYNSMKFIVNHNGKNAILVGKEDKFLARKPREPSYHVTEGEEIYDENIKREKILLKIFH